MPMYDEVFEAEICGGWKYDPLTGEWFQYFVPQETARSGGEPVRWEQPAYSSDELESKKGKTEHFVGAKVTKVTRKD